MMLIMMMMMHDAYNDDDDDDDDDDDNDDEFKFLQIEQHNNLFCWAGFWAFVLMREPPPGG